jgi:alkanesulfonate monooxygenase SsuD/methylene tetrahydromethanopterin reductase-like flavin-dependent oxidoreductase (luciferase family)
MGFDGLVGAARDGGGRAELASRIPLELLAGVGVLGTAEEIAAGLAAYYDAGADHVAVVPSTAEDPAGRRVLEVVSGR